MCYYLNIQFQGQRVKIRHFYGTVLTNFHHRLISVISITKSQLKTGLDIHKEKLRLSRKWRQQLLLNVGKSLPNRMVSFPTVSNLKITKH